MGDIIVAGLPSSRKTPGTYLSVILGGPGAGGGATRELLNVVGNMLEADLTGSAPSFTIAKGTAALATPVEVFGEQDAIDKFGRGSELHLMCRIALAQNPNVPLWATPMGQAAGAVAASQALTFSGGPATADSTLLLYVAGERVEVVLPKTDPNDGAALTVEDAAKLVAQAVLDRPDLPVTAQAAIDGVGPAWKVTLSAKQGGTRGNRIPVRAAVLVGTKRHALTAGGAAATYNGLGYALGGSKLAGGTGTESTTFDTVKSALAGQRWHRIALASEDSTNIASMLTQLNSKAGVTSMLWEQLVVANVEAFSTASTGAKAIAAALNGARAQLAWHYNSHRSPGEIAAALAAGRLLGDSNLAGGIAGESSNPAQNLDGLQLAVITAQDDFNDQPLPEEIEAALNYGVTPLVPSNARPGFCEVARSITTRHKDGTGALNYAVLDTTEVTVTDHVADRVRREIAQTFPHKNLASDAPDGTPPKVSGVVTPSMLLGFVSAILKDEEDQGHIINVDAHAKKLKMVRDSAARGRINAEIPCEPAPGFHLFGGNVRQQIL